jgi:DNA-binding MarR family transcriptional regulator
LSALTRSRALSWNRKINREAHFQLVLDIIRYFAKLRNMNLVFKALSDPTRRQILHLLRTKPMTAGDLAEHFSLAKSTLSGHFAVLREAGRSVDPIVTIPSVR